MTFEQRDAILTRFFAAIPARDIDTVASIYHPDVAAWHNFDNLDQSLADNLRTLGWVSKNVANLRYEEVRRAPMGTSQVVQQHVLRGTAPNGSELDIPACIIFTFDDDGRITRLEEYLDSAQTAALRG
jgi:ketosteroid isomerase-like protein